MTTPDPNAPAPGAASTPPAGTPATPPPLAAAPVPPPPGIELPKPTPAAIESSGDPGLDLALEFFAQHGIDGRHPALKAARDSGDFSTVKALLAEKGASAKGFERYVDVAQRAADTGKAAADALREKTATAIYDVAGGKDSWDKVREWAAKNATDAEFAEVNSALKQGGVTAKAMAAYLVGASRAASGAPATQPKDALPLSAARQSAGSTGPMGPREFQAGVAALTQKYGTHNLDQRPEYKALIAARRAHRA